MLTNHIPLERVFHNDKMWYNYAGVDEKGKPIIEEVPYGSRSYGDNKYYRLSDDRDELYNYWVNVLANQSDYEKMNEDYSTLLKKLDERYSKNENYRYIWDSIPLFQYLEALNSIGEITKQQMLDGVVNKMETILSTLTVGKVMSKWSEDSDWNYIIASVKYDKEEKILKINCVSFCSMGHHTRDLHVKIFDLKTVDGFYGLGQFLSYYRGHWKSLDNLIENYEKHLTEVKNFISNVKKINSKKEKLYGKI